MADLTVSSAIDTFMAAANQAAMLAALNITLGGAFATSGAFTTTLTVTGNTNVTLPTSGTLAILGANTFTAAQTINTGALTTAALTLTQIWNNAGVLCRGVEIAITNTNSAANSTLFRILGGAAGTSQLFNIDKNGWVNGPTGTTMVIAPASGQNLNLYPQGGGNITCSGSLVVNAGIVIASSQPINWNNDLFLYRKAAATLQLGLDAAGVTNQMITACSRITSDGVGANLTIAGGNGRGGAGGSLILSYYTTAAAATIGTLTEAMRINTLGQIILTNLPTSDPGVVGALYRTAGAVMISV